MKCFANDDDDEKLFLTLKLILRSRDSVVGIAAGYGLDG
jgi:hypothetical protein